MVFLRVPLEAQCPQQIVLASLQQLVEDVEAPLAVALVHHAGLLQQVVQEVTPHRQPLREVRERDGGGVRTVTGSFSMWSWRKMIASNPLNAGKCLAVAREYVNSTS